MATFVFDSTSSLSTAFDPTADVVVVTANSAQDFVWSESGGNVVGTLSDGTTLTLEGVTRKGLAVTNFQFVDGSGLQFGDGTTNTIADDLANSATTGTGTAGGVFVGFSGVDSFAGGKSGDNNVQGNAGNDALSGGGGADTIRGGQGNDA
ncbi:calcium-binding protein, partial [Rhodovibrionaceae bacterium A322]